MNYSEQIKKNKDEHAQWIENIYRRFNVKSGSVTKMLNDFNSDLVGTMKQHPNISEYKKHFWWWLCSKERVGYMDKFKRFSQTKGAL